MTQLTMSNFKKKHPLMFRAYYNPVGARKWVVEMEIILESLRCIERHKVMFATLSLVEEATNWWNLTKPSVPTSRSIILWEVFNARFLENYSLQDSSNQEVKGKQIVKGTRRVQMNKRKDDKKIQKLYVKSPKTARKSQSSLHSISKECYHCRGKHLRRNCHLLQQDMDDKCYVCCRKGHFAQECWFAKKPATNATTTNRFGNPPRNNNSNNNTRDNINDNAGIQEVSTNAHVMSDPETAACNILEFIT